MGVERNPCDVAFILLKAGVLNGQIADNSGPLILDQLDERLVVVELLPRGLEQRQCLPDFRASQMLDLDRQLIDRLQNLATNGGERPGAVWQHCHEIADSLEAGGIQEAAGEGGVLQLPDKL